MEQYTSTDQGGASLVMEDCRTFGCIGHGVCCNGKLEATRCMFENNGNDGVCVNGGEAMLVDCVVCNNERSGVYVVNDSKHVLTAGTISGNKRHGVLALRDGKVTVAAAEYSEVDREQTVSSGNRGHNWATQKGTFGERGEIEGLAEGIQAVGLVESDSD